MRLTDWLLLLPVVLLLAFGMVAEGYAGRGSERAVAHGLVALLGVIALGPAWRRPPAPAMFLLLFFLIPIAVGGLLLIPLPAGVAGYLSPFWAEHFGAMAAAGLEPPARAPLGLDPEWGHRALNQWVATGIFFLAALMLAAGRQGRWWLLAAVVMIGLVEGWLAFFSMLAESGRASGALFNPNHSAALILLTLPAAGALVYQRTRAADDSTPNYGPLRMGDRWILPASAVGAAMVGWFSTLSRASLLVGVCVLGPWLAWEIYLNMRRGRLPRAGWVTALAVTAVGAALLTLWFAGTTAAMAGRFENAPAGYGRVELWTATAKGLAGSRFAGVGLGGAAVTMERFLGDTAARRTPGWTHNDYIQLAAELGAVGLVLLGLWAWRGARLLWRLPLTASHWWLSRRHLLDRALLAGILTVLLHSLVDFPLRIPLVGFCFLAIVPVFVSRLTRLAASAPLPAVAVPGPGGNPP